MVGAKLEDGATVRLAEGASVEFVVLVIVIFVIAIVTFGVVMFSMLLDCCVEITAPESTRLSFLVAGGSGVKRPGNAPPAAVIFDRVTLSAVEFKLSKVDPPTMAGATVLLLFTDCPIVTGKSTKQLRRTQEGSSKSAI